MTTDTIATTTTRTINATDSGLLVYIDAETQMAACIGIDGLSIAHARDLTVGVHPYATATAWTAKAMLPTLAPAMVNPADLLMVEDWIDWCDDVFARYAEHSDAESIASSAQQTGAITDARYIDEVNATIAAEESSERAA